MCRWLAYSGSPLLLEDLLYKPQHSLIDQSLNARQGPHSTNGDGFGIGDLPGAWNEVEPSTYGVIRGGQDDMRPFAPIHA